MSIDSPVTEQSPKGPSFKARPRESERATRKPMPTWDRIKFLLLLGAVWFFGMWAAVVGSVADQQAWTEARETALETQKLDPTTPIHPDLELSNKPKVVTFEQSFERSLRSIWVFLFGLELLRQVHYLISENFAGYHRVWNERVLGGWNRRLTRANDWNRFRLGRTLRWLFWLTAIDLVLAQALDTSPVLALFQVPILIFKALPIALQMFVVVSFILIQFIAMFWFLSRGGIETMMPDDVQTRFSDVWGQDHVLEQVKENLMFLQDPVAIEKKGGYVPGGILLWGPPGTGKTLMAEAAAGETEKPFVFVEPGAFVNTFMGVGIIKVKLLFRRLRKLALRYGGVVVFFDEADALGNRGSLSGGGPPGSGNRGPWSASQACNGFGYFSPQTQSVLFQGGGLNSSAPAPPSERRSRFMMGMGMGRGGDVSALTSLLAEISGLKKPRGFFNKRIRKLLGMRPKPPPRYRILMIMATNQPDVLDEALLRPGRIDRIYRVGYPSKEGRKRTYEGYLKKLKHELTDEDIDKLALMTPYATGASIKDLTNEALIVAIRDGRDSIIWRDIVKARLLKSLGPPEDVEYIERERHAVAIHEACHAVAAYRVRRHLTIDIATIEKGQSYLGMVASIEPEQQFTQWRSQYEADLIVSLASLAGERIFFDGDSSSGVHGDLESATAMAMYMEGFWGMGTRVGSHGVTKTSGGYPMLDYNLLESSLGHRVETRLEDIYKRAVELLENHRDDVLAVAHALESEKTLTGDDVAAVIKGEKGPLIDGTLYQDPEFRQTLEAYHSQVVTAHKGHSRPVSPLPRIGRPLGDTGGQAVAGTPRAND